MKPKALILLFIFMSFLALPTVLSRVCNDVDISIAYTIAEEEENQSKTFSEVFQDFTSEKNEIVITSFNLNTERIIEEFLSKHDNVSSEIFSPPPERKLV